MTAKDLVLVLVVAAGAGGAAALASGVLHEPPPPAEDRATAKILERLDRIENSIAASREDAQRAREAAADLSERVAAVEIGQRRAAEAGASAVPATSAEASPAGPRRVRMPRLSLGGKPGEAAIALGGEAGAPVELKLEGDAMLQRVLPAIETEFADVGEELRGVANGFRLRALPEEKRWEQAKADVGISDTQVETLKRAVEERDAAMKDAFQVEEESGSDGASSISIRRMDPSKAAEAQTNYRRKVDETLDDNQRKSWREKGYDHAFGSQGGGGAGAVFVARTIEVLGDSAAPKDGK